MSVFSHTEYRMALVYAIDRYKRQKPSFTQTRLAEKSSIHNTFISNVFKGRSDFHGDQIYAIGEAISLDHDEIEFINLLMEHEKATNLSRKKYLKDQINSTRNTKLKIENQLKLEAPDVSNSDELEYYLNPYYMIIHTALRLKKYAKNPERLARDLGASESYVRRIIKRLEEMQFVGFNPKKEYYEVIMGSRHLPKDSPLCIPHQTLLRNQGLRQIGETDLTKRNFFTATFLGSEKLRSEIEKEFHKFTKKIKDLAEAQASSEAVYQMNFDLFPWTEEQSEFTG